jgi:starch synthase
MMKKRILIISNEINPYLEYSNMGRICNALPKHLLNEGAELRILMPRFGNINERRHKLHEVVRLSGINIIMGDDDMPL